MELLLYICVGALFGGVILGKRLGNLSLLIGAIIAIVPEIDVFIAYFLSPLQALLITNTLTHSVLFIIIASPLLALILNRLFKEKNISLSLWTILSFWSMSSNCIVDFFTINGASVFYPFVRERYAISSLNPKDFFLLIPLATGVILLLVLNKYPLVKKITGWFYLLFFVAYLGFTVINKVYITSTYEQYLFEKSMPFTHLKAFPKEGSNFKWNLIARNSDGFWLSETSNFSNDSLKITFDKKNEFYLIDFEDSKEVVLLKEITDLWYNALPAPGGGVYYIDMRYGKNNDSYNKIYHIYTSEKNRIKVDLIH